MPTPCRIACLTFSALVFAWAADAQPLRGYVAGTASIHWQDQFPGTPNPSGAVEVSGGWFVTSRVAFDASVVIPQDQSFDWGYAYSGSVSTNRASVTDLRVIGYVRLNAGCYGSVCFQPVFGGGINRRHAESIVTADCGSLSNLLPCTPISTAQVSDESDQNALVVSFGVDVPLRVLGWMQIGPSLRFDYVDYGAYLFPYPGVDHRGPSNPGPWAMRVGARVALGR